jgi:hypothetical protein
MWVTVQRQEIYTTYCPLAILKSIYDNIRCWCDPEIQDHGTVVVHYSKDGREFFEDETSKGH